MAYNARYIMQAKLLDQSGEAWVSAFNEQAEVLLGVSADNLAEMRGQVLWFPNLQLEICDTVTKWMDEEFCVNS